MKMVVTIRRNVIMECSVERELPNEWFEKKGSNLYFSPNGDFAFNDYTENLLLKNLDDFDFEEISSEYSKIVRLADKDDNIVFDET